MKTISLIPKQVERLSAKQFVKLSERQRADIERVRIEPARLGSKGFGKLIVKYKTSRFVVE